jgi:hypothetical protein
MYSGHMKNIGIARRLEESLTALSARESKKGQKIIVSIQPENREVIKELHPAADRVSEKKEQG